jgi:uncharacterized membrane protein
MKRLFLSIITTSMMVACEFGTLPHLVPEHPDFVADVKPIFQNRCIICHNRGVITKGFSLENRKFAMAALSNKHPIIFPGHPDKSLLIHAIVEGKSHHQIMPPITEQVTARELHILKHWISDGAPWPEGSEGSITPPPSKGDY